MNTNKNLDEAIRKKIYLSLLEYLKGTKESNLTTAQNSEKTQQLISNLQDITNALQKPDLKQKLIQDQLNEDTKSQLKLEDISSQLEEAIGNKIYLSLLEYLLNGMKESNSTTSQKPEKTQHQNSEQTKQLFSNLQGITNNLQTPDLKQKLIQVLEKQLDKDPKPQLIKDPKPQLSEDVKSQLKNITSGLVRKIRPEKDKRHRKKRAHKSWRTCRCRNCRRRRALLKTE